MALSLTTTFAMSYEASEEQSGPTNFHSTDVEGYGVQPDVIGILQEAFTNKKLSNNEKGFQCTEASAHILDAFQRAGFSITSTSTSGSRKTWLLTRTDYGDANP